MVNMSEEWRDDILNEATAMAKRGYDEVPIRNKIASQTRGGEFADKATKLADRETYGNKEMKAGREKLARKQRGTFRDTTSSSPGLRGYGHQSSDPAVKAKQDARGNQRARAALTPNERKQNNMESYDLFDYMMEYLMIEGYANTNENALVIMANMSEEWRESIVEVTGRGRIDPIGNTQNYGYGPGYMPNTSSGIGERNSRTPEDAGLRMSPLDRAKAKANSLKKRDDPESTKRANRINSRFVNPTERAFQRSMLAAANVGVALRRKSKQDKAKG
jgi:hypothetical protein